MNAEQELKDVINIYRNNLELETKIEGIRDQIRQNNQLIIKYFFPYLLSIYGKWRPKLEEKCMYIDLEYHTCFELTIKEIDGYQVRAQEGQKKNVHHRFYLNQALEKAEIATFIIPQWSYVEIKDLFELRYLE